MPIVDTHVHVTSADTARYPRREPAPGASWFVDRPLDIDGLRRDMDEAGVDRAVVVQGVGPYAFDNTYLLDAVKRDPARVAAVAAVDPTGPDASRTIAMLAEHPQVPAIRLPAGMAMNGDWLDDERADAVWTAAAQHHLSLVLWAAESDLPRIGAVARRHRDVAVALDHCGGATFRRVGEAVEAPSLEPFVELDHVLLKVTTAVFDGAGVAEDPGPLVVGLAEAFGTQRLMWGSNHPASGGRAYREMRELAERSVAGLSASDRAAVLGGNATRIYGLR